MGDFPESLNRNCDGTARPYGIEQSGRVGSQGRSHAFGYAFQLVRPGVIEGDVADRGQRPCTHRREIAQVDRN